MRLPPDESDVIAEQRHRRSRVRMRPGPAGRLRPARQLLRRCVRGPSREAASMHGRSRGAASSRRNTSRPALGLSKVLHGKEIAAKTDMVNCRSRICGPSSTIRATIATASADVRRSAPRSRNRHRAHLHWPARAGTRTRLNPRRAASRMRRSMRPTRRTSPPRPTSPQATTSDRKSGDRGGSTQSRGHSARSAAGLANSNPARPTFT